MQRLHADSGASGQSPTFTADSCIVPRLSGASCIFKDTLESLNVPQTKEVSLRHKLTKPASGAACRSQLRNGLARPHAGWACRARFRAFLLRQCR